MKMSLFPVNTNATIEGRYGICKRSVRTAIESDALKHKDTLTMILSC